MRKNNQTHPELSEFSLDEKTRRLLIERDAVFLDALFREVNPFLARICISNGIFSENADEVIHETWESFFTNLGKFEGRSQIRTYICGILFNKIREYRRARAKTIYEEDSEQVMEHAFTSEGWWNVEPTDPSRLMESKQVADFVKECLEGLSEQQKAAFVLREVEDEDSDSICRVLGVNVTHLRVLLFRAKDKLRKCIEGQLGAA
jgi:RNA polymerase sigma factor (sigma-70 family)